MNFKNKYIWTSKEFALICIPYSLPDGKWALVPAHVPDHYIQTDDPDLLYCMT